MSVDGFGSVTRPKTRGECDAVERPCPFRSCRHNLGLDVLPSGRVRELDVTPEWSCALDVAERGGVTLEAIGDALGVVREHIRKIEAAGLQKVYMRGGRELLEERHLVRRWR